MLCIDMFDDNLIYHIAGEIYGSHMHIEEIYGAEAAMYIVGHMLLGNAADANAWAQAIAKCREALGQIEEEQYQAKLDANEFAAEAAWAEHLKGVCA